MPDQNTDRLLALEAVIAARLKPICAEWPPDLFNALVRKVASISLKYNHAAAIPLPDPHVTDLMIAEMRALAERSAELREELAVPEPAPPPPPDQTELQL